MKRILIPLILALLPLSSNAQSKMPEPFQSSFVRISPDGVLDYYPDESGNTIPDFSRVGYHHMDKPVPVYPVTKAISPVEGDNWANIQSAIDELSSLPADKDGHRGVLLLKSGTYPVSKSITISKGGIVLRGEGSDRSRTLILATSHTKYNVIVVSGEGTPEEVKGTRTDITDAFVPTGTFCINVASTSSFKPGDKIIVYRPGTDEWIHDLMMDRISERPGTKQWKANQYNLGYERQIEKIDGNTIYLDNPVVMQMETKYGGGQVYRYEFPGRISEVGIEDICFESVFEHFQDSNHGWLAISLDKAENCWIKNITARYFGDGAVKLESFAKNVTVDNSRSLEPKSPIAGGYRTAFNVNGQQNLVMNCHVSESRHDYAQGARSMGPNVFYNCTSVQQYADSGPHHRWSSGTLYDNISTDGDIDVQDRGHMGSGHGWTGVTQVLWNCRVKKAAIQSPWVSGKNYSIGTKGEHYEGAFKGRPDGEWEGQGETNIQPRSLFQSQLMSRKGGDLLQLIR